MEVPEQSGSRRSYRLRNGGSGRGLETSRGRVEDREPADIEGARSRSHVLNRVLGIQRFDSTGACTLFLQLRRLIELEAEHCSLDSL